MSSEIMNDFNGAKRTESVAVPKGWEPYTEYTNMIGEAIVHLPTPGATEKDLLISAGFNPDEWKISGEINTRKWQRYDQEWLYYYKFDVAAGESEEVAQEHIDALVARLRIKAPKTKNTVIGDDAFVVALADFQIGKSYKGNGTDQAVTRIKKAIDLAVERLEDLRAEGKSLQHVILTGLGDLVENCSGHYDSQLFVVDRNGRDQSKVTRELLYYAVDSFYDITDKLTVITVGGNHGESRSANNKKNTDDGDNLDVAVFECIKEAYDRAGIDDIEWIIPDDELSLSYTVGGVTLGITHGHLFRNGASAQLKAKAWWQGQVFGYQNVEKANILLSGHYHHYSCVTYGIRTHFQTPAMDCGSKYFTDSSGEDSPPGMLTFRITSENPFGWDDNKVLWT